MYDALWEFQEFSSRSNSVVERQWLKIEYFVACWWAFTVTKVQRRVRTLNSPAVDSVVPVSMHRPKNASSLEGFNFREHQHFRQMISSTEVGTILYNYTRTSSGSQLGARPEGLSYFPCLRSHSTIIQLRKPTYILWCFSNVTIVFDWVTR